MNDHNNINTPLAKRTAKSDARGVRTEKNALPVRDSAWVRRFVLGRYLVIPAQAGIYLVLLLMVTGKASADTTWVSGAVSGEWTREGNPYIVIDSTWVPEGERLTLTAGVEAFFNEGQGLYVFGTLNAEGRENDSVRFVSSNVNLSWLGITLFGSPSQHTFDYCVHILAPNGITLGDGIRLYIGHSVVSGDNKALGGPEEGRSSIGGTFTVDHSVLLGERGITNLISAGVTMDSSLVYRRIQISLGRITARGCTFYDDIDLNYSNYYNCRFFSTGIEIEPDVHLAGVMENCYSEIQIQLDAIPSRVLNLESSDAVVGSASLSIESSMMSTLRVNNSRDDDEIVVRNCTIGDEMRLDSYRIEVFKSVVFGWSNFYSGGGPIIVDSSEFHAIHPYDGDNEFIWFTTDSNRPGTMRLTHSLVTMPLWTDYLDSIAIENNTFSFNGTRESYEGSYIDNDHRSVIVRNNIFFTADDSLTLFRYDWSINRPPFVFQYNMIYGFPDLFELERYAFDIDSTNLEADPSFVSADSSDFHLRAESPCIDAGDPGKRDPDGSRSDIGAHYFHQNNFVSAADPPRSAVLLSAFPNPFNSTLIIRFAASPINREATQLAVFGLDGRLVATLLEGGINPALQGSGTLIWNDSEVPAGSYFLRLEAGEVVKTERILLVR